MPASPRTHRHHRRPPALPASEPPPLRAVAELLHEAAGHQPGPVVATLALEPPGSISLGLWPVPVGVEHPADPLIGLRAPAAWCAVGLVATGTVRPVHRHAAGRTGVAVTVLVHRDGGAASVLDGPDGEVQVLEDPPQGWAADALARVLGRPTPPPADPPSLWLEAAWLDRVAAGLLARPERGSWRWLAERHPLAGTGPTPTPEELARRTQGHAEEHPWSALRGAAASAVDTLLGPDRAHPPDPAEQVPPSVWFDDGSYARWLLRQLPPPELLLPDLVAVLEPERGADLLRALTAVSTALVVDPPP